MSPKRRHHRGLLIGGIVAFWGIVALVLVLALGGKREQGEGKGEEKKGSQANSKGIDREKILKHMTSESDTVIFFSDRGDVKTTSEEPYLSFRGSPQMLVTTGKNLTANMSGTIYATWSAKGIGKRFTRQEAEVILDDCIKLSNAKPTGIDPGKPNPKFKNSTNP